MSGVVSYTLRSNGVEFAQNFKVKSIIILNEVNRIPRAKVRLLDGEVSAQDFPLSNIEFFKPGNILEIDLGHGTESNPLFKGVILKHSVKVGESNRSYLEIECKHQMVKLTVNPQSRFFNELTDKEVLEELLGEANLDHQIEGLDHFVHPQLVQYESTDWDFMMSRVDSNGCLLLFDDHKVQIVNPAMGGEVALKCEYGANVLAFEALIDGEELFSKVEAHAWDPSNQAINSGEATETFNNEIGNIDASELAEALNSGPYSLKHSGALSDQELTSWASAKSTKMQLAKVRGQVTINGDNRISPGKIIELKGFGDRFTGKAFVTGVRHEMSNGNWTTNIQFGVPVDWFSQRENFNSMPSSGLLPSVQGIQIGVVTKLEDDPEHEFRIQVRIPIMDNEDDGVWARVVKSYAGNDYGSIFYPEIGDEVMVGFINNDPRQAVVLGAVHSSANVPSIPPTDDNYEKGIISKEQLKFSLNDQEGSISITTPGGRTITLNDQDEILNISDSYGNMIEFSSEGIKLKSVKDLVLESPNNVDISGLNITSKANGKFAAEGNTGAEMKTSSIAVVKGSLVQIN